MAVTYKKLFHLLIDRGIQTSELTEKAGFSPNILLDCKVDDILEFIPVDKENENG